MNSLLMLLQSAALGKVLLTGGSMLISIFVYALFFGWRYAAGFIGLIFVHEMGHFFAARRCGLHVGAPTFIPFVGAWMEIKEMPHDAEVEAYVGMAGPVTGTMGALACFFLARYFESELLLALSYAGLFLNLFNLIPLSPFDGGRITAVISPRVWLLGVPILIALFFWFPSPLLILMAMLAAPQVMAAIDYDPEAPENAAYYGVRTRTRVIYAAYYLSLAGFLAVMAHEVHQLLEVVREQT